MSNFLKIFKGLSVFLLAILTVLFFELGVAFAHTPHDNIFAVEISPNYDQDQTLFLISHVGLWGNLLKSEDGGQSWKTIVKGLDNKDKLSSLGISSQSPKTLFLSSRGDGIYKSQDGGASWFKVNQGLGTLNIDLVSISSDSSDVVLAAGTETELYKTKNGGESWDQVLDGESQITVIAFSPEQKDHIVLGDNQGVLYESNDEGEGWKQLFSIPNSGAIKAIAVSPNFSADRTLFVGTEKGGILKTVDGGISFKKVDEGLSDPSIMSLAISPNYKTDSTLFASTWQEGVFYSNNGGNTWQKYSQGLTKDSQADQWEQPHFNDLRISPKFSQDKTIFLGGFDGIFKSTNGGRSWKEINVALAGARIIKRIALSPNYANDSTVAIATIFGGAYISNDEGVTWTAMNKGLVEHALVKKNMLTNILSLVFSPNYRSDKTIFSMGSHNLLRSTDGGKHWKTIWRPKSMYQKYQKEPQSLRSLKSMYQKNPQSSRSLETDLRSDKYMVVSPNFASDNNIYVVTLAGLFLRSTDGGESFSAIGNIGSSAVHIPSLVISPNFSSDKTIYTASFGDVYKTGDGGYRWQTASNGIPVKGKYIKSLAISPSYQVDKTVFAGTREGLYETKDGGESWRKLAGNAYGGNGNINTIAISPNYQSDRTFIIKVKGRGLFKTVNGGKAFTRIGDYLTGPIKFSPSYSIDRTIYRSSGTELLKSTDGGNSWETLTIPADNYNFMTFLYLRLTLSRKLRFLVALVAALLSYLLLGYLGLEKRFPLRKWQIRAGGAFAAFIVVLILLST